ncbi:MAG: wax ester/triacylglycerol synthase family O-acyltransferase [Marinovum sp.]|nr:wax ester/triacylglycerol synthase family O-acyltransferase [Marinovum sp.]
MKQLSGIDATFLYMETPETPMHVGALTIVELPKGFRGSFHKHFKEFFSSRVHLVSIFNQKLAKAAWQLDHPGWVDAGELDFDYHIKGTKLAKPGTLEQAEAMVAELHETCLDRAQPLWQITVIEGLEGRRAAVYVKMHHAAIDGQAGMAIAQALCDFSPTPRKVKESALKEAKRKPTAAERSVMTVHDIFANLARQQLLAIESVPKVMGQVAEMVAPVLSGKVGLPQMLAPSTPFNKTIVAERRFAARQIPLLECKAIAKATGTKLNDVVMAVTAGALRRYLTDHRALPDAALIAFVPISMRDVGNTSSNNQVFGMNCALATNYGDPLKRLEKIHAESQSSKALSGSVQDAVPAAQDFTLVGAPTLLPGLMQLYGASKLADVTPQAVNLCISNTMGAPMPLYVAGAKVTGMYPVSIATHNCGLNVTVQSYTDQFCFGLTASANAVPDIDVLADYLMPAFGELKAAVEKRSAAEAS